MRTLLAFAVVALVHCSPPVQPTEDGAAIIDAVEASSEAGADDRFDSVAIDATDVPAMTDAVSEPPACAVSCGDFRCARCESGCCVELRDAGAPDAGPMRYDLAAMPSVPEIHGLYGLACADCGGVALESTTPASCTWMTDASGPHVAFGFHACSPLGCEDIAGGVFETNALGTTNVTRITGAVTYPMVTLTERGSRYTAGGHARMNFHIEFRSPSVTGVPGRTVSPTDGDIWLLGCPLN